MVWADKLHPTSLRCRRKNRLSSTEVHLRQLQEDFQARVKMASMAEVMQQPGGCAGGNFFKDVFWGPNGWEELKKVIKGGTDFCKELSSVLQERVEVEQSYAKSLQKVSSRLAKLCKEASPDVAKEGSVKSGSSESPCQATVGGCWNSMAEEMEAEAEIHRSVGNGIVDEIIKPIKSLVEAQSKAKKQIEQGVDKKAKALTDRRSDEAKAKKTSFTATKENEKMVDQLKEAQGRNRSASVTDKDIAKMESKLTKIADGVVKSDNSYHEMGQKAESARQDWESAVYKAAAQLQMLEEERISQCSGFLRKYSAFLGAFVPAYSKIQESSSQLEISVNEDIRLSIEQKSTGANVPEQMLFSPYACDLNNPMELERRTINLQSWVDKLESDIARERKAKEGIQHLAQVYTETPSYADMDARADVAQRLIQANATINFIEASQNRIQSTLDKINRTTTAQHWTTQYMEPGKDKLGFHQTILRVPYNVLQEDSVYSDVPYASYSMGTGTIGRSGGRGMAPSVPSAPSEASLRRPQEETGASGSQPGVLGFNLNATTLRGTVEDKENRVSNSILSDMEDEFDTVDMSNMIGQSVAQFHYAANQDDELTIYPGDVINVYDKSDEGWWQGELKGKYGLFPASYVKPLE